MKKSVSATGQRRSESGATSRIFPSLRLGGLRRGLIALLVLTMSGGALAAVAADPSEVDERATYRVVYTAWLKPGDPMATVRIRIASHPDWVRWMKLRIDPTRYRDFKGTGRVHVLGDQVQWTPPKKNAWLQYSVNLESQRDVGRYDGRVTQDWALFRADDLVPPVHLDMKDGTRSKSKLSLELPEGWTAATPYPRYASGRFAIDNPKRLFDRPTGWILVGKLGIRREEIGGTQISIAGPIGQGVRRLDMLAFFRFTVPTLQAIFPDFPDRVLVVSAGDPMWRGALSGPRSLFVHSDRPFISENATSTFIHELVHVAMGARSAPGADWIVEGLAEYYSLEVLRRSGAISERRNARAHAKLAAWGKQAGPLDGPRSSGAVTARAVGILRALDEEIRAARADSAGLDDVVRSLPRGVPVTREDLRIAAERVAGGPLKALAAP